MEDRRTVLDHIDGIEVSAEAHHNNLTVLQSLDIGLFKLAESARQHEVEALERFGNDNIRFFSDFGSPVEMWLGCMFDWFAISLVSYMRTVQLMRLMEIKRWDLEELKQSPAQQKLHDACEAYIRGSPQRCLNGATKSRPTGSLLILGGLIVWLSSHIRPCLRSGTIVLTTGLVISHLP